MKWPKLDGLTAIVARPSGLRNDVGRPRKQRHTAKRVCDRLREEQGFTGSYTINAIIRPNWLTPRAAETTLRAACLKGRAGLADGDTVLEHA